MKTIVFFDRQINERGTSVCTYDYAHFNETILGNKSIIASYKNAPLTTYDKFKSRFGDILLVDHFSELDKIQCDYVYDQKFGFNDGNISKNAKNLIHCAFESYEPHGDVYAYVSKWLADKTKQTYGLKEDLDYVPYMINLPDVKEDFKEFFNIPHGFLLCQVIIVWVHFLNHVMESIFSLILILYFYLFLKSYLEIVE